MRYRDCPTVEVSERIDTTPEAVWALVTDISLPVRTSAELREVEWVEGSEVAVGNRFRGRNEHPDIGQWHTESVIVEVEPLRRWVYDVQGPDGPVATWGFEVDPGPGPVTLRQWARMGPGRSGLSAAIESMAEKEGRIVARRLAGWESGMRANLAWVKQSLA
ncbi:SRPBCC family protein [Actinokineospora pegani]|uniref:SRPBCC family protein n=1 Tax=Actinokineospora pegani TaxID=2654637 RepID=UPI0012EAB068|nr:SRPBCC family protein [Actinokineospora pegani]